MQHLCAYLLLRMGGFREPTADDIHRVLASVDLQADDCRMERWLAAVERDPEVADIGLPPDIFSVSHYSLQSGVELEMYLTPHEKIFNSWTEVANKVDLALKAGGLTAVFLSGPARPACMKPGLIFACAGL
jgi:hypothetical protein